MLGARGPLWPQPPLSKRRPHARPARDPDGVLFQGGGDEGRTVAADRLAEIRGRMEQGGGRAGAGGCPEELVRAWDAVEAQVPGAGWGSWGCPRGSGRSRGPESGGLAAQGTEAARAGHCRPSHCTEAEAEPRRGWAGPPVAVLAAGPGTSPRAPLPAPATCPGHSDLLGFARACAVPPGLRRGWGPGPRWTAVQPRWLGSGGQSPSGWAKPGPRPGAPAVSGAV